MDESSLMHAEAERTVAGGGCLMVEQRASEAEITADDFVSRVNSKTEECKAQNIPLITLILRELEWTTLRRRQLSSLPTTLSTLTSFTLSSRPGAPFNGNTLARLISPLHRLKRLALRGIEFSKHSIDGIPPPTFELRSLALLDAPRLTKKHLRWLLHSTSHAESLRNLSLDWHESPAALNTIRYCVLRVTHLDIQTTILGLPESLVIHFPSLEHLVVQSTVRVGRMLFDNLQRPLLSFRDEGRMSAVDLVEGARSELAFGDWCHIQTGNGEAGMVELQRVCRSRKMSLKVSGPAWEYTDRILPPEFRDLERIYENRPDRIIWD